MVARHAAKCPFLKSVVPVGIRDEHVRILLAREFHQPRRVVAVLAGQPNENIAADLGVSQRTAENHRAAIMRRTGAKSLPALARLAVAAEPSARAGAVTYRPSVSR